MRRAAWLFLLVVGGGPAVGAEKVPDVALGPEAWTAAVLVEAPIARATVFSDRARVQRRARVAVKVGINLVRFPDLAGAAFTDTIRLAAGAARVLRVETTAIDRERLDIAAATKLLDELDAVDDRVTEVDDRAALENSELELLARLQPAAPVPEDKREGRKLLAVDVTSWGRTLDYLTARTTTARDRLVRLGEERRQLAARRDRVRADLRLLDRGGLADRTLAVLGVVEAAAAATIELELEYTVPGARWKPIYDLHFSPGRGQLRLDTAALVEQASGEDWEQAVLAFSTAIPGRGIDLPQLLTWTLGERGDFVPTPRPKNQPHPDGTAAPGAPAARSSASEGGDKAAALRERMTAALSLDDGEGSAHDAAPAELHKARDRRRVSVSAATAPPPVAPAPMQAMPREQSWSDVSTKSESASSPSVARSFLNRVSSLGGSRVPATTVALDLDDAPAPTPAVLLGDPLLPAVSAGGLDHVYQAAAPATVPSTGKPIRVPLDTRSFRAAAFYQATPALAATAFLRARVRNDGQRPLLRGSAAIFTDGEFVGQGEIQTTGPGGDIEFPLGADQDIRLIRQVVPRTQTTGVIRKTDETDYDVEIQIGNYKKQAIAIDVSDQIPRSTDSKIEVKLIGSTPVALAPPDADGVLRWRVELGAGATATIKLRYQITRPAGWKLYQR